MASDHESFRGITRLASNFEPAFFEGKSVLIHAPILARKVKGRRHIGISIVPTTALMDNQARFGYAWQ